MEMNQPTAEETADPILTKSQHRRLKKKRRAEREREEMEALRVESLKIQQDGLVSQMIAESLVWYYELPPEQIQAIVQKFLDWKEKGGPKLEQRTDEVTIPHPSI